MGNIGTAQIARARLADQGADPASPPAGYHYVYTKAGGLYLKDATGAVVGPFAAGFSNPMTTQDDLIVGGVSGAPGRLAKGGDGQVLTVDPTTHHLAWATPAAGFTDPMTTRGDIIVRNAGNVTARLGRGAAGRVLKSDGTDVAYGQVDYGELSGIAPVTAHQASHQSGGTDPLAGNLDATARVAVRKNTGGANVGARRRLNLIEGTGITITAADDAAGEEIDITLTAAGGVAPGDHNHTATAGDGGVLTNDEHDGYGEYAEIAAPSTPAANKARVYAKDVGGTTKLFLKDDAGTETDLTAGAGSTAIDSYAPYAYAIGLGAADTATGSFNASAGVGVAIPILVPAKMDLESVSIRNLDTTGTRSWEWRLYKDLEASGTLSEIAGANGSESFTATAASTRTAAAGSPPIALGPGVYWLVLRNTQGVNAFNFGAVALGTLGGNAWQSKNAVGALAATLDFATAWNKQTGTQPHARLNGRSFAAGAAF